MSALVPAAAGWAASLARGVSRVARSFPALALVVATGAAAEPARVTDRGISVTLQASPSAVRDGDALSVSFTLKDEATGTPLAGARPAAWMAERKGPATTPHDCAAAAARFLGGALADRAPVDFNAYYVLALNDDASIGVVDPRFSFGGSQLLATVRLESPGEDWALAPDGKLLFVSMPEAGKVAAVDTGTWAVRRSIATGGRPGRVALQPDGARLWVAGDRGVAAIDAASLEVVHRFPGPAHAVTFSDDSRAAFLAGSQLRIADTRSFEARAAALDFAPSAIAWSSAAQLLYAGGAAGGVVAAVQPKSGQVVARVKLQPGFAQLRFAPGGRYAFLPNPASDVVQVLDAATNQVVQTADVKDAPDQVTFTDRLAFIRRQRSDAVIMIPLQRVGAAPGIGLADFTGGQHPLGAGKRSSPADSIVEAPDGPGVLVANPADRSIYYYREGMAAPMGSFGNYGREPRAVLVVDRSLRERPGGTYAASAVVADPGAYDVVFFLDSPRVTACFPLDVAERPETRARREGGVVVTPVDAVRSARAGQPARIRFRMDDAQTHQPRAVSDVSALVMQAPGVWQRRTAASPAPDGTWSIDLTPPAAGTYYVWVASASAGLPMNNPQFITLEVH